MNTDRAFIANVVPRAPREFTRQLNDWLVPILQAADENNEFELFDGLAASMERALIEWRGLDRRWAESLLKLIASCQRAGWRLTGELPSGDQECFRRWLGPRLVLWPAALKGTFIRGIISSRLTRSLDARPDWFRTLRVAVAETSRDESLMIMRQTAGVDFVRRTAELLGKRTVRVHCHQEQEPWFRWLLQCLRQADRPTSQHLRRIYLSPRLNQPKPGGEGSQFSEIPQHDRALVAGCDTLFALRIRPRGHVHQLLRARLACQQPGNPSIRVAVTSEISPAIRSELMDAGAVGWAVQIRPRTMAEPKVAWRVPGKSPTQRSWIRQGRYLTHCTRRRNGPWPDQTQREYQDDLILQRADVDHSALAALRRIVRTKRLVATSDGVRGDARVVSFTAVPLEELRALRIFRPHRGRWDFEPYGLCIETATLRRLGFRPVTYVDHTSGHDSGDLSFLQKAKSTTGSGGEIDWTVEWEWRYDGDLDLTRIADHAICLFVPTLSEARELQLDVSWPVLVLPPDNSV